MAADHAPVFGEWLSLTVLGAAFLGALTWPAQRVLSGALLTAAALGTLLAVTVPTSPALSWPTLLVALISGATIGVTTFARRTPPNPTPATPDQPAPTSPGLPIWARTLTGLIFLWTGLYATATFRTGDVLASALFTGVFLSLAVPFLPGRLPVRVLTVTALAVAAGVTGTLIDFP